MTAAVAVPLALSLVLAAGGSALWWLPQLQGLRQLEAQPARHNTCLNETPVSQRDVLACTWGPDRTGEPIYLVGDSNAQQYTEGMVAAGASLRRPVVVLTMGSCLPAVMQTREDADNGGPCQRFVTDLVDWLGSQRRGTVVLAGSAEAVFVEGAALRAPGGPWVTTGAARERVVSDGLTAFADRVRSEGHEAVIVEALPHLPGAGQPWWLPADCPNWRLATAPDSCGVEYPLAALDRRDSAWLTAQRSAVSRSGATLLRIRREVCPDSICRANTGGLWVYRDGVHITPTRSAQLGPYLATALPSPSAPR